MKSSLMIIISNMVICLALSGCGANAPDLPPHDQLSQTDSNSVTAKAPEKKSFMSKWVRDRSKDYVTTETLQPLRLRNGHLAEKFNDDYKIPGE